MEHKQRKRDKMEYLYTEYRADVFRFALSLTKSYFLSEDITSDVFLKAFQKQEFLKDQAKTKSWLLKITRNICMDYLKKCNDFKILHEFFRR